MPVPVIGSALAADAEPRDAHLLVLVREPGRVAAIVTSADPQALLSMASACQDAASVGASVRVFFRDESIPAICRPEAARVLLFRSDGSVHEALEALAATGDARLHACSSSLYIWGVGPESLIPAVSGARGLIAFLADDLAGADRILSY